MNICIYCSSSDKIAPAYFHATQVMCDLFLEQNMMVTFGGGSSGLMGAIADIYCEKQGRIRGIMPQFMKDIEWAHTGVTDFIFTEDMRERKEKLIEGVDAVVALAGGTGTLEELMETITLKRLGKFLKPIIILNTDGFYDDLRRFFGKMIDEKFLTASHGEMWTFVDKPEEILPAIHNAPIFSEDCIHGAVVR